MRTSVTTSSLTAYRHLAQSGEQTRTVQAVAEVILEETRAGRMVNIAIVQKRLRAKTQMLWEKSTISARMNDLKNGGIRLNGTDYTMRYMGMFPCPYNKRKQKTRMYQLVLSGVN